MLRLGTDQLDRRASPRELDARALNLEHPARAKVQAPAEDSLLAPLPMAMKW